MKKNNLYILLVILLSSCAPLEQGDHAENEQLANQTKPDKVWICRDFVYDDHIALELTKTSVTVGDVMEKVLDETLRENDSSLDELKKDEDARDSFNKLKEFYAGSIQLSGEESEGAIYYRQGLNHRWEWGDGYVFVLEPSGQGYYYDFTNVEEGESVKASDNFKCKRK